MSSRRRAKDRREYYSCSTPVAEPKPRLSSISVSAIDTNSSSDGVRKRKALASEITPRKKRITRQKRAKVVRKSDKENKRLKNKKATSPKNYDSDWVTESEASSYVHRDSSNSDTVLFKDLQESECVREAYHVVDDPLNTSFFEPLHREDKESEKIGVEVDYELLPTTSHLPLRIDDTDDEDEEFVLRRENVTKKYPGRTPRKPVSPKSKSMEWLIGSKFPTALSNTLWDNYMRNHPTERSTYVPQPNISINKNKQNDANSAEVPLGKLWPELKKSPSMGVTRGTTDKQLNWVRKYDVYQFPESENDKFEFITLRDFRRKQNAEKEKMLRSKKVKPQVTSIKLLRYIRYIKHGENWRIVRVGNQKLINESNSLLRSV